MKTKGEDLAQLIPRPRSNSFFGGGTDDFIDIGFRLADLPHSDPDLVSLPARMSMMTLSLGLRSLLYT